MGSIRISTLRRVISAFVVVLSAGIAVTASSAPAAVATTSDSRIGAAAVVPRCGCGFTITGSINPPAPPTDPAVRADSEFAEASPQLAAICNPGTFAVDESLGHAAALGFGRVGAPYAQSFLNHFLNGSGTQIDVQDGTPLASEVKQSPMFQAADNKFQLSAKTLLDQGKRTIDISSGLYLIDFSHSAIPDLLLGFGGTQGLQVSGSGHLENGDYVGAVSYTIQDIYGFSAEDKFLGAGPRMHYLQGVCGAPYYMGGARWYPDSITVIVPFDQPIG